MENPQDQSSTDNDTYTSLISQVMEIEDITWGSPATGSQPTPGEENVIVRYRGQLRTDVKTAYSQLAASLRFDQISTIFQEENGRHAILLIKDPYSSIVSQVLNISETAWGSPTQQSRLPQAQPSFTVQYRGKLILDSQAAYDKLASQLRQHQITPLFRKRDGQDEVTLLQGVIEPKPSNPLINLILFVATLISMAVAQIFNFGSDIGDAAAFAVSLLTILLAHELGHYLAGRYHGTAVTLPYFIPIPFFLFGTAGAFIRLKEPPKNKRILLDIGVSGPLAGLVFAIPILILGLTLSEIDSIPAFIPDDQSLILEGNSILYLLAKFAVFGEWLPSPLSFGDTSPLLYWVRYFFTGSPTPLGGMDVIIHPVAWAGWAGLLVTALNLIPAGQLDGGHLIFSLLGKRARTIFPFILGGLVLLGFAWSGWWLWVVLLIVFFGRVYAEPLDQITELDTRRKAVAVLGLIIFILVFTPLPLVAIAGGNLF
jgi:membrane-associated protease RseP (regulator of RpoE activity)